MMQLQVITPMGVLLDLSIQKIDFETVDGYHTLLPKHVDFVTALTPTIVSYTKDDGKESYMACNKGVVVKKGKEVHFLTKLAVLDDDLNNLRKSIAVDFKAMEEARKETNKAMAHLEVGLTRGLMELKTGGPSAGL